MRTIVLLAIVGSSLTSAPLTAQDTASTLAPSADWSRALALKPGTLITVAVRGSQPVRRSVVRADPTQLTVLNLSDPLKPPPETIARDEIVEISARRTGGGVLGRLGVFGGYFAGALSGGYLGALICRCDAGFLPGMVGGGISGGVMGYRASRREREQLIYRVP